ncbi:hypothetical protein ACOSQ3_018622 [Xanthoceras sorbifolium]
MEGQLQGIKVASSAPSVSHLLFADDSLIFSRVTVEDCSHLKEILKIYEQASGQSINFDKSTLSFSPNSREDPIRGIKGLFNIEVVSSHEKYLGPPFSISINNRKSFRSLLDKVWQKLQG